MAKTRETFNAFEDLSISKINKENEQEKTAAEQEKETTPATVQPEEKTAETATEQPTTPAKRKGRPKSNKETKIHLGVAIYPSLKEDISKIAWMKRMSASELICSVMESYVQKNREFINDYDRTNSEI